MLLDALRLLTILIGLFHRGPVAAHLRNDGVARCGAPNMALAMADLVDAAERHFVPPHVLAATCLDESGLNLCGTACGVMPGIQKWACAHGAQCDTDYDHLSPARVGLQQQFRAAAFLLARQHIRAYGARWAYAVQGFHLGGSPQHLRSCPASHRHGARHHGVYALTVLAWARRIEEGLGVTFLGDDEREDALWSDSQGRMRYAER